MLADKISGFLANFPFKNSMVLSKFLPYIQYRKPSTNIFLHLSLSLDPNPESFKAALVSFVISTVNTLKGSMLSSSKGLTPSG